LKGSNSLYFAAAALLLLLLPFASHVTPLALRAMQLYERILKNNGFPYFVNGAGGAKLNSFNALFEPGDIAATLTAVDVQLCQKSTAQPAQW
jgi:hypothetical protein